jgi:transposase-like protein
VVQQAYVEGVSTRRVDDLVQALGCEGISKSQVSRICGELDRVVADFLGRPLDAGPYRYLWLDALTQRVREGGRIVQVSVVVATGVNAEGKREVLGIDVGTSEDGAFWLAFLRGLMARGLSGVELVTSRCAQGLKEAIATVFNRGLVAALPHPLHVQPALPRAEERAEPRRDDGAHDLPAALGGGGVGAARPGGGAAQ